VQALQAKQVTGSSLAACRRGRRALGFLPGTLSEKIRPYLRPLYAALHDMVDPEQCQADRGRAHRGCSLLLRGRSLNDSFIVLDEAQNTLDEQMKMFLTRLGFGSRMVITGDTTQVDLPGGTTSGLRRGEDDPAGVDDVSSAASHPPTSCGTGW